MYLTNSGVVSLAVVYLQDKKILRGYLVSDVCHHCYFPAHNFPIYARLRINRSLRSSSLFNAMRKVFE